MKSDKDVLGINTIRDLLLSCIGDTDVPPFVVSMNAARISYVLWTRVMRHDPLHPEWMGRDRFVIGAGVNAIIHFAMLYLTGYDISLEDMKRYRQLNSITPGHPEAGLTPGVEETVGSFGEALGAVVGLAMAEKHMAALVNEPGFTLADNYTYAILYDGDLQEGISHEAATLAGYMKLGKLICLYNSNSEAALREDFLCTGDDLRKRFSVYGWSVADADGTDPDAIAAAIAAAKEDIEHPTLIFVTGADAGEMEAVKAPGKSYAPPQEALDMFREARETGGEARAVWAERFEFYKKKYPGKARLLESEDSANLRRYIPLLEGIIDVSVPLSTVQACKTIASRLSAEAPELFGGACLLMPDPGYDPDVCFTPANPAGNFIRYGNREQGMGAIMTGISRYGGLTPYATAFLVLSDYMRPSIRAAAMMKCNIVYLLINDSVWNGQDGPTHQPVEQIATLRAVPGLTVMRPADASETVDCWRYILSGQRGPVALVLSKNPLPAISGQRSGIGEGASKGAYILYESRDGFQAIIIATGSEVAICQEACEILEKRRIGVRLVSMPSWELFEAQDENYRSKVLPKSCEARVSVEAGCSMGWEKYTGRQGINIAIDRFGLSAPGNELMSYFGFEPHRIALAVEKAVKQNKTPKGDHGEKVY